MRMTMSSGEPGREAVPSLATEADPMQPGPFMDSMHAGLMRVLGWKQTFAALREYEHGIIKESVTPDDLYASAEELHRTLSARPVASGKLFELLKGNASRFAYSAEVGAAELLLSAESNVIEKERRAWVKEPIVRKWLGKAVVLQRPTDSITDKDDNWASSGPPYRGLFQGKPASPYYPGGGRADFHGKLQHASLEQSGTVILGRRDHEATGIIEMFEAIKDPETGLVIGYVPRVSVERVSGSERLRLAIRNAAVDRPSPITRKLASIVKDGSR
jgi:hypothetical protein